MSTQTKTKPDSPSLQKVNSGKKQTTDTQQLATEKLQAYGTHYVREPARDLASQFYDYAKRKPDVATMWCFACGLIVGWKLRG